MKVDSFKIFKYSLPLDKPLYVRGLEATQREGLIIQLTAENGQQGIGEIAPLLGMSEESLPLALKQTAQLKVNLLERPIPENVEKLNGGFESWLEGLNLVPSVRFGIETAILNLFAQKSSDNLARELSPNYHNNVAVNGLLYGTVDEIKKQAKALLDEKFIAMKLKVGGDVKEDIEKVKAINEIISGKALLHVDANQRWSFDQAIEFGEAIGCAAVDYIEEPFKDLTRIPEFFMKTFIPVALDESLTQVDFEELKSIEGVDFIVIKPTVLGGIEKTWQIIQRAKSVAINPILSSSYESEIGVLTLANIAAAATRNYPCGLDTLKWFKNGVFHKCDVIENGKINIDNYKNFSDLIDFDIITEVYDEIN